MKKRNVHVISKYFYPVAAGIENNIMQTYAPLARHGWDITIHTSKDTYDKKNTLPASAEVRGLKIIRYKWNKVIGYWPSVNWNEADIVCLHNFNIIPHVYLLLYTLLLKLLDKKGFALFITPHGGYSPEWRTFSPIATIVKKIYHKFISVHLVNWSVDGIRAVSDWEKQEMADAGISENIIKVIKNGLEDEAYLEIDKLASNEIKRKVEKLGNYIIQIGRVYPIKNQEAVIEAMPQIDNDVKFAIVGPVQELTYKEMLIDKINELNLEGRVEFLGVIRGVDKYYLLRHAKAMVHMALWEGNCNVVHEAWSQNLVCVVADSKGLNEQIKNDVNGFLIKEKDVAGLARKVNYILKNSDSKKLDRFRRINQKYVRQNSWKAVSENVGEFYMARSTSK